jgi:hypothetical protein
MPTAHSQEFKMPSQADKAQSWRPLQFSVPTQEYRGQPIPGLSSCKVGDCFVRVTDLPDALDGYMKVNPRVPNRSKQGVLTGPVIKGIQATLTDDPEDMAIKNRGIYVLAESAEFQKMSGGAGRLTITLNDPDRHGIVNGGHTYAAIRDAIEHADEDELEAIQRAYVRLHVLQGIDEARVPEIAEGLNRSKQVDDPSLDNLRRVFDGVKAAMRGKPGEKAIAYHQGDDGELYIPDVLVHLQLFNSERYTEEKHPYALYRKPKQAVEHFKSDLDKEERGELAPSRLLVPRTYEILALADKIRMLTPQAAKRVGFQFGRMKTDAKKRAGSEGHKNTVLPFINKTMNYRVPRGWLMPMLAGFRANVEWNLEAGVFNWRIPPDELLEGVMDDLVRVCVTEHRDNNMRPEWIGNRESSYRQYYDRVLLYLARRGKLTVVQ